MQCFVCAQSATPREAVALCPDCSAGLCKAHVAETAAVKADATSWASCGHSTWKT